MAIKDIFLVAKYTGQPKNPRETSKPGYVTNPDNMTYEEQIYITRGLRNKDLNKQVILNLTQQQVIKNSFKSDKSFEEILAHYVEGYGEYINNSIIELNKRIGIFDEENQAK